MLTATAFAIGFVAGVAVTVGSAVVIVIAVEAGRSRRSQASLFSRGVEL